MTASDVLRALLAIYPPDNADWTRSGSLPGEPVPAPSIEHAMSERSKQFLRNFDIDGDGTFSCEEFILFLVMLSMPLKDMQSIFVLMDADGSQTLDKDEFLSAVEGMLEMTGHAQKKGISRGQILFTCDRKHEPFIDKWFGKDGERKLALADFMAFIVQLHHIFDELEFALLDADGSGSITGLDLARSLVAPASIQSIDQLLSRAEDMPDELKVARIDEATFMKAQAIVSKYHRIGFPLRFWQNTKHTVDDAAAIRLMEGVCRTDMPPVLVQIFSAMFKDDEGRWDGAVMNSALQGKYQHISYADPGGDSTLSCLINCIKPVQP